MKFIAIIVMVVAISVMVQSKDRETFMIGGSNATAATTFYAYLEIFRQVDFGGPTMYFGGGTVISTSFILTCAQNVAGFKSWRIGLGAIHISNMQWFLSTTAFIHHGYDERNLIHNIALLRLTQHTTMGTGITIMTLPAASYVYPIYSSVVAIYGFGFGTTNHQPSVLQTASFTTTTQKFCEDSYLHLAETGQTENHFCAEDTAMNGNICAGDQGGPAIYGSQLVGIQSYYRYENCGSPEAQPAAFIRVPKYVAWINNVTTTQKL